MCNNWDNLDVQTDQKIVGIDNYEVDCRDWTIMIAGHDKNERRQFS